MLHRTRHLFIRQQTAVINTIRAHLVEFGVVAPVGRNGVEDLLYTVADERDERIPEVARACLEALGAPPDRREPRAKPLPAPASRSADRREPACACRRPP